MRVHKMSVPVLLLAAVAACTNNQQQPSVAADSAAIAPGSDGAVAALAASPRHGEWVTVAPAGGDSVRAWLVYPERATKAPVVVVVQEIFGLSNWIRAVTDQLAADGFIAIAPDLMTRFNVPLTAAGEPNPDTVRGHIDELNEEEYQAQIRAAAEYAMNLPAATKKYGVVGFCWGGGAVFAHAVAYPDVNAVVSYYGTTPAGASDYEKIEAPVLGLYGGSDERVGATIPRAESGAKASGFTYEPHKFEGAGHGFLRAQDGQNGANRAAAEQAWPMTVAWFTKYLEK